MSYSNSNICIGGNNVRQTIDGNTISNNMLWEQNVGQRSLSNISINGSNVIQTISSNGFTQAIHSNGSNVTHTSNFKMPDEFYAAMDKLKSQNTSHATSAYTSVSNQGVHIETDGPILVSDNAGGVYSDGLDCKSTTTQNKDGSTTTRIETANGSKITNTVRADGSKSFSMVGGTFNGGSYVF
jgi:hypothetical protein